MNAEPSSNLPPQRPPDHAPARRHAAAHAETDAEEHTRAAGYVVTRLASVGVGPVTVRRLGRIPALFHPAAGAATPFALVSSGTLYFKTGPDDVTKYIAVGMRPLRADPRGALRGYFAVPGDVLADDALLAAWAASAVGAAAQFGRRRPRPLRRPRRPTA